MKKIRTIALMLMVAVIFSSVASFGASAEGFSYDFESHCKSIYMFNLDDGTTLYSKNADEELPMASLTKIMTYIVAYENIPDIETTVITVPQSVETDLSGTGSSLSGVLVGEKLTALQVLNLMMIPSGNDAALTLAKYVDSQAEKDLLKCQTDSPDGTDPTLGESDSAFINLMNKKALELGCANTHFVNAHGLYDPDHYTTARDMAKIAEYATTLPYFTDITSSTSYTLPATNMSSEERTVFTTNKMLTSDEVYGYAYATGIKTGSLDESGYCIVSSASYNGYTDIIVALGSPMVDSKGEYIDTHGEMLDSATLFRWAFTQLENKTLAAQGDLLGDTKLEYAWNKDTMQLVAAENVASILPTDVSVSSVVVTLDIPEKIQAPIKKGDIIGSAVFSYAGAEIGHVNVVASESVSRSEIVQTVETTKAVVTSPLFLVIFFSILAIVIFYVVVIVIYNRKKKKMKRVKKYRDL